MTVLWDFPLASSWSTIFFLSMLFSWKKVLNKMASFRINICCNVTRRFKFGVQAKKRRKLEKIGPGEHFLTSGNGQTPSDVKLKVPSLIFFEINNNLLDILGYIAIVF